ncbi:MAG: hypothetical protein ACK54E_19605 [Pseudanabaena sp.]|nr:hypothetical protein [Pseudanabaena sp. M179S2SP2A07QC]MCA6533455.1 hypothetical protein [Pseudanabaena sp. M176S2SP2A07QC]MCA6539146.1 hypothetical protein [Pseudanabaena sp. M037S2SP2A07QC]MCA6548897.1 hypothetical protein [Pseudanabaena sp. M152S2SP2A07QC]MCA6557478.1 hypothetical protein [Pseudanabaena sp. M114S2SP2A07QC]MCA6563791.1 hypothetical protein [Pseudanabaena sp. M151S2SP2A07QC]MCA6578819.1 hypothetical protein [Pseudanabaena sp. M085S1SP2A07QC]
MFWRDSYAIAIETSLCPRLLCGASRHVVIKGTNWLGLSLWLHHLHEVIGFDTQNPFLN